MVDPFTAALIAAAAGATCEYLVWLMHIASLRDMPTSSDNEEPRSRRRRAVRGRPSCCCSGCLALTQWICTPPQQHAVPMAPLERL